ncbi:MAG TPA: DEAD/DEAH box helicase, partial [Bdellovibrionota bacterium]|nr:DEAD/DEAH box helicase [Bdellovibrionota bacterium]
IQSGRIAPLGGRTLSATREDMAVDAALGATRSGVLDASAIGPIFSALAPLSAIELDGKPVRVSAKAVGPRAAVTEEGGGFRLALETRGQALETFANGAALCEDGLHPRAEPSLSPEEGELLRSGRVFRGEDDLRALISGILPSLRTKLPVDVRTEKLPELMRLEPRIVIQSQPMPEGQVALTPRIVYPEPPAGFLLERNLAAEKALARELQSDYHLKPGQVSRVSASKAVELASKARERWSLEDQAELAPQGELTASIEVMASGELRIRFESGDREADAARALASWRSGDEFAPLLGGGWARLPRGWLERFGEQALRLLEARGQDGRVASRYLPELARFCEETGTPAPADLSRLRQRLESFEGIPEARLPSDFTGELRPYQRKGVDWLCFLRDSSLGALLADDMGLGKTLQALCAIRGKTLIVAPTSVLHSWASHLERFRPSLRFCVYHGAARELDDRADVVLTSYALLRLDQNELVSREWDTAVLDEAQLIRNPQSQTARAAHALKATFRVALSGTPIENRAQDLWSQFQFLNPGVLGQQEDFERRAETRPESVRALIRPFLLRRLKREVAPELPERTEVTLMAELSVPERELYQSILAATRAELLAEQKLSPLAALEALLRLRQACCHPALVPGSGALGAGISSKLSLLVETLEESLGLGHRALVFSQWTSLLDLIGRELESRAIRFSRLDGSTPDREKVVGEFQAEGGPPVMLLSLKAGGVGITLTAADHVFIVDPWWNPAAENQAADRAHRIGQKNPVLVHRLVARETVEEKILALQERKMRLAEGVLAGAALEITREDLLELLK